VIQKLTTPTAAVCAAGAAGMTERLIVDDYTTHACRPNATAEWHGVNHCRYGCWASLR